VYMPRQRMGNNTIALNTDEEKPHEMVARQLDEWSGQLSDMHYLLEENGDAKQASLGIELLGHVDAIWEQLREGSERATAPLQNLLHQDIPAKLLETLDELPGTQGLPHVERCLGILKSLAKHQEHTDAARASLRSIVEAQREPTARVEEQLAKHTQAFSEARAAWDQMEAETNMSEMEKEIDELEDEKTVLEKELRTIEEDLGRRRAILKNSGFSDEQKEKEAIVTARRAVHNAEQEKAGTGGLMALHSSLSTLLPEMPGEFNNCLQWTLQRELPKMEKVKSTVTQYVKQYKSVPDSPHFNTIVVPSQLGLARKAAKMVEVLQSVTRCWSGGIENQLNQMNQISSILGNIKAAYGMLLLYIARQCTARPNLRSLSTKTLKPRVAAKEGKPAALVGFLHAQLKKGETPSPALVMLATKALATFSKKSQVCEYTSSGFAQHPLATHSDVLDIVAEPVDVQHIRFMKANRDIKVANSHWKKEHPNDPAGLREEKELEPSTAIFTRYYDMAVTIKEGLLHCFSGELYHAICHCQVTVSFVTRYHLMSSPAAGAQEPRREDPKCPRHGHHHGAMQLPFHPLHARL
jgi:hypothetical protein